MQIVTIAPNGMTSLLGDFKKIAPRNVDYVSKASQYYQGTNLAAQEFQVQLRFIAAEYKKTKSNFNKGDIIGRLESLLRAAGIIQAY